jgi:hypothetical protein
MKKIIASVMVVILLSGCSSKKINTIEKPTLDTNTTENNINDVKVDSINEKNDIKSQEVSTYKWNKAFNQSSIVTTVEEISIYKDNLNPEYNIICFNLKVQNESGKDVYLTYDISPIILNTGEQVDETDRCNINRLFKSAVKEGQLLYSIKSKVEDIKTIRWILTSPLYNGSEIIGEDCDFTFDLTQNKK